MPFELKKKLYFLICILSCFIHSSEIAVVSLAIGENYKKIVATGIENKRLYCTLHGYDFICVEKSLDPLRPPAWSKILLILELMQTSDYKWIFWTDADSLIMNMTISLEDLIVDNYNLILSKDNTGINTGQFLIKNCDWSKKLLQAIYSHTECIHHYCWEQQGLVEELQENEELWSSILLIPQRTINSYTKNYENGDFIIHFAGHRLFNILEFFMNKYNEKVIYR